MELRRRSAEAEGAMRAAIDDVRKMWDDDA